MKVRNKKLSPRLLLVNAVFALKQIWNYSKRMFGVYALGAITEAINPVIQAYIAGALLSELALIAVGEASRERLILLVVFGAATQLVYSLITSFKQYYFEAKRELMEVELTDSLLRKQVDMKLEELELPETRDKFEYATSGINELFWYVRSVMDGLSSAISIVATLFVVYSLVPWATIILAPLPLLSTVIRYRNYIRARSMWDEKRAHRVRAAIIERMLARETGILELRFYGLTQKLLQLWRKERRQSVDVRKDEQQRELKSGLLIDLIESSVGVAVDIWLVFKVFAASITIGTFEQIRRLISNYILSLSRLSGALSDIVIWGYKINDYRTFVANSDVAQYSERSGLMLRGLPQTIQLKNVEFTYPTGTEPVLQSINMTLKKGENIAIVGENGAGKTTLLKVLMGAYNRTQGDILLDGVNIDDIDLQSFYEYTASLFQDFEWYDFLTIGRSISISGKEHDEKRVKQVLKRVGMLDFTLSKAKGLDTNLGYVEDDGIELSGGQWQRFAIARALYKDADLLIMDEPTSAIDAKAEQEIMDYLHQAYAKRTIINVSHRLSTVSRADRIIVMKAGRIVEEGTHEQLFNPGTAYYDLFHKQAARS